MTNTKTRGTRLSGAINGNLTDNVTVSRIARFNVGGQINVTLTCGFDDADAGGEFIISASSFGESGVAKANAGDISLVQVTGNMLGDLRAPNGQIVTIDIGGNIGSPTRLSTITARVNAANPFNEAFELISADNIYANIIGTADISWLGRLETTGSPGNFVGSLSVHHINWKQSFPAPGIFLTGSLDANVTLGNGLSSPIEIGGDLASGKKIIVKGTVRTAPETLVPDRYGHITINGSLLGDIEIGENIPQGVQGFVTINAGNASGTWSGDVKVRTPSAIETLSPTPAYSQSSASITDTSYVGAVGLVPFRLHATDCEPAHGQTVDHCSPPTEIRMRHYGPVVDWDPETDPAPFSVWRRRIGTSNTWIEHSDCFTQERDATNATIVVLTSSVALPPGYEYKVSLVQDSGENILRCDTPGQPEVADHTSDFIFTVGVDSPGDANGDGKVDFDDIASVNANWQMTNCLQLGDADRDGDVDFDDISSVIANWLNEYATCKEEMMMAGFGEGCERTMEDAIAAMAFESATEYAVFLAELSEGELVLILKAVAEWLDCER